MEIEICNVHELQEWDARIGGLFQRHELDYVLGGVRQSLKQLRPFDAAGITLFAIRYSLPPIARGDGQMRVMQWDELAPIANLVTQYLITDPIGFKPPVEDDYHNSTLIPPVLRLIGNQLPYNIPLFGQYARSLKLFHQIPQQLRGRSGVQEFDIDSAFQKITGVPIVNFIDIGYLVFIAAVKNPGFTGGWFQKARDQGMRLNDDVVIRVLDQFAADQWQLRELYERYKQPDRRYGMYDFNPLWVYPIVRPWPKREYTTLDEDRLIAPLPGLILTRLSEGIYHQLFNRYRDEFAKYFGYVFETYAGEILQHSISSTTQFLSESEVKRRYKGGKVPDYVMIDGSMVILAECKATGYQRKALATADAVAIDYSVSRIIEGLIQLHEFKEACEKRVPGLERLHNCTEFKLLIITYEPFYIVNSTPFKQVVDEKLTSVLTPKNIRISPWYVLGIDQIEKMQPHLADGVEFEKSIDKLIGQQSFHDLLGELAQETGRSYKDSLLYEIEKDIYQRLEIPVEHDNDIHQAL